MFEVINSLTAQMIILFLCKLGPHTTLKYLQPIIKRCHAEGQRHTGRSLRHDRRRENAEHCLSELVLTFDFSGQDSGMTFDDRSDQHDANVVLHHATQAVNRVSDKGLTSFVTASCKYNVIRCPPVTSDTAHKANSSIAEVFVYGFFPL